MHTATTGADPAGHTTLGWRERWVAAARFAAPAVGLDLAVRAVSLAVMYASYRLAHANALRRCGPR